MIDKPIVIYTDHVINKTLCYNFAKGSNSLMCHVNNFKDYNKTIATYGILRGTGDIIEKVNNFYYIDHGYLKQSKRTFQNKRTNILDLDGYFRIVYNDYMHVYDGKYPDDRLKKLNLKFSEKKTKGDYIILSEPLGFFSKKQALENKDWVSKTTKIIRSVSDRKIIIHNKFSKDPLNLLLKKAWAFVSLQSTAAFEAMQLGVPAYFTNPKLENINYIKDIEKHEINYSIFNNLAYGQWNLEEIRSGEAWETISKKK